MRFLFISSNPSHRGGSEHLWVQTALHLKKLGHHVEVLTPWRDFEISSGYPQALRKAQIPHHALEASWLRVLYPRLNGYRFRAQNTKKLLAQRRFDLCLLSNGSWSDAPEIAEVLSHCQVPFATVDHGISALSWPGNGLIQGLQQSYPKSVANFFVAQACADLANLQLGLRLPRVKIAKNPFQVSYRPNTPWPSPLPCGTLRLACIGRIELRQKAQELLIQLFKQPKWKNRAIEVHLIGDGPHYDALQQELHLSGITQVKMLGRRDDIEAIWRDYHGLILPSRYENLPIVVVEAMLCARPCIVTDVGGNRELITDGVNGFLAESACVPALDRALEQAWEKREEWQRMGELARESILRSQPEHPEVGFAEELLRLICPT